MPATATISPSHRARRQVVVNDMAAFLLQHHAAGRTFVETVEAALAQACGFDAAEWFAVGILSGHYRHGASPDPDTTAAVLERLESMLPTPVPAGPTFEGIR